MLAAYNHQVETLEWLRSKGCNIFDTANHDGNNAVLAAALNDCVDTLDWLYRAGCDLRATNKAGDDIVFAAAAKVREGRVP